MRPDECRSEVKKLNPLADEEMVKHPQQCLVAVGVSMAGALWEIAALLSERNSIARVR